MLYVKWNWRASLISKDVCNIKNWTQFSHLHEQISFALENLLMCMRLWALQRHRQLVESIQQTLLGLCTTLHQRICQWYVLKMTTKVSGLTWKFQSLHNNDWGAFWCLGWQIHLLKISRVKNNRARLLRDPLLVLTEVPTFILHFPGKLSFCPEKPCERLCGPTWHRRQKSLSKYRNSSLRTNKRCFRGRFIP